MKKIIIGAVVGTIIFFGFQASMWMSGAHSDMARFTDKQDTIVDMLGHQLNGEEGLYMMPGMDPAHKMTREEHEAMMKKCEGKPWAMVFYHKSMKSMGPSMLLTGVFISLLICLIVAMVVYNGNYTTMGTRFLVAFAFAAFALIAESGSNINWWDYPWSFVKTRVVDMVGGWGLVSLWFAWYLKKPAANA